jgi:hypothetical protein
MLEVMQWLEKVEHYLVSSILLYEWRSMNFTDLRRSRK